jgi:DNA-binding transcriptional ArsR family regulator/uncharacterized protein YndB with AHSA1/START domain
MDDIFRALGDPHRRRILDLLRERDGQTLSDLETKFPQFTRFGLMKHLKVLEDASLIATRKAGRFKYHYLNPVPIQTIADRWISNFAAPWARGLSQLKWQLEQGTPPMAKPKHVYTTIIRTKPEALWDALTNLDIVPLYYPDLPARWADKATQCFEQYGPDGAAILRWTNVESDPPRRLVRRFEALWSPDVTSDKPSRVVYEIEEHGECCKLTIVHDEFETETATFKEVPDGWPAILAGLKTLLETGKPLLYKRQAA